jgi:murein DD-endopeptidase MepM/ murein hydrolase activator NlpD
MIPVYLLLFVALSGVVVSGLQGLHRLNHLQSEKTELEKELKLKHSQLAFMADRMSQIREELAGVRILSRNVEVQLGRNITPEEGGAGGPLKQINRRDVRQVAYMNSESELLDKMWTEIEEIEMETKLEHGKNASLYRFLSSQGALLRAVPSIRPINGGFVSSPFGRRNDPFTGALKMHTGLDIAHSNRVPVYATAEGIVTQTRWSESYGNLVTIYHGFGLSSRYAHLHRIDVQQGDWIDRGQPLGLLGSTGRSTHRHLHYEVRIEGRPVNPYYFLPHEKKS